jgi:Protein of unknown function (DUF1552)
MALSRSVISRRTVLRGVLAGGVSVAVPLPRLEGMLNSNGTAYAGGAPLPVRFGVWFFGNGIIPERWVPALTGAGATWTLSEQLAPLAEVKPWLSVVTGTDVKVPDSAPHASAPAGALSGANNGAGGMLLPSIDQVIAKLIGTGTTYPTGIHVGVSNTSGATALGDTISFAGAGAPNRPNFSPLAIFTNLMQFANTATAPPAMPAAPDPALARRGLVLDAVIQDANALRARVGAADQKRLDQHLEGINELQVQLMRAQGPKVTGKLVNPGTAYPNRGADGSISRQRAQAFADLLVFAMATDLTRIFSFMFTPMAGHGNYADCGLDPVTFHEDYGHRNSPRGQASATAGFNTGVRYAMTNLADLLGKMKNTPDGAGTLLDNSCVYTTSCTSESQTHSPLDFPVLVSGKAGGKLKGNQHLRLAGENTSKVLYTLATAYGGTATSFGMNEGLVTSGIPELLA